MRLLTLAMVLLAGYGRVHAWEPGKEVTWLGLGEKTPLKVYIPSDYDPANEWPLLYGFHVTGGRASTSMFQGYTRGRGFVLIGAPYALPGKDSFSRAGILQEIRRISKVRQLLLGESLSLDQRTYVGGFSKGGWMSDLLATEGFDTLSGALILGAGRIPDDIGRVISRPKVEPVRSLAIYIGIGQLDSNHLYSRRAHSHYLKTKHDVVFEEYLTKGHRVGETGAPYLSQWLQCQVASPASLEEGALAWWQSSLTTAESIPLPIERLLYLEHVQAAPFAKFIPKEKRSTLSKKLSQVRRHRSLQTEMDARRAYRSAQKEEEGFRKSSDLPDLAASFKRLYMRSPKTFYGQRAGLDLVRMEDNYRVLKRSNQNNQGNDAFAKLPPNLEALKGRFARFDKLLRSR